MDSLMDAARSLVSKKAAPATDSKEQNVKELPTVCLYPAGGGFNGLRNCEKYRLDDLLDEFLEEYDAATVKTSFVEEVILKQIKVMFWEGTVQNGHAVEAHKGDLVRKIQQRMRDLRKKRKSISDPNGKAPKKNKQQYVHFDKVGHRIQISEEGDKPPATGIVTAIGYKVQLDSGEVLLVDAKDSNYSWVDQGVEQLNLEDGTVTAEFDSIQKAALAAGMTKTGLEKVLSGKEGLAGGFFWRLAGSQTMPPCDNRPVQQLSLKGKNKVVATHDTIQEAAKAVKGESDAEKLIEKACWGQVESAVGFRWKFAPVEDSKPEAKVEEV